VEIGSKNENVRNSFILLESALRSVVALIINDITKPLHEASIDWFLHSIQ
jgi:hypothetical protein